MFVALGVDVAAGRGLDLVFLDARRRLVGAPLLHQTAEELGRVLRESRPALVAIDSPPAFGTTGASRPCERELLRLGISLYSTPSDPKKVAAKFYDWMRTGCLAFGAAKDAGYPAFDGTGAIEGRALEVFPHGSAVALKGILPPPGTKSESAKREWRKTALESAGVATRELRSLDTRSTPRSRR